MKILLAGDSTVANCPAQEFPMSGWGAHLAPLTYRWGAVHNFAKGGAGTESFREEGLWADLLAATDAGDLVLVQFGHNDQKKQHLAARTGYAANLRTMVGEVRACGAVPVLCTPVERRHFLDAPASDAVLEESLEDYPEVVRELCQELAVPVVDLNAWTRGLYRRLGPDRSRDLFCHFAPGEHAHWPDGLADNTHFSQSGAALVAAEVARQLGALRYGGAATKALSTTAGRGQAGTTGLETGILYSNPLAGPDDMAGWVAEGPLLMKRREGTLELSGALDDQEFGDHAHWTVWCPRDFPDGIRISWDFRPLAEPGLAMLFFAATGQSGLDLFSPALAPRSGYYPQYHSGDIDTLHVSYFRHKYPSERAFRTCNLRKSAGFELVAQGADPLPPTEDAAGFYRLEIVKDGPRVAFSINGLLLFEWHDSSGKVLGGGRIGFRQMAPLRAAYRNLVVERI